MKHMEETAIDQAFRLAGIAKQLFTALRTTDCNCVETEEYTEYQRVCQKYVAENTSESDDAYQRLAVRLVFMAIHPFEGVEVAEDCARCKAMEAYEDFCGQDNGDPFLYIDGHD